MLNDKQRNYYEQQGKHYGINSLRRAKILKLAQTDPGLRILDIGCATGLLGQELKQRGNFVAGVDISQNNVAAARQVLDEAVAMDIESDPWPDNFLQNKFDLVICAEIIEHLFDQEAFLIKLKDVLKPAGEIIFSTPNFLLWNNRLRILRGQFGSKEVFYDQSHIHLLSHRGFKQKLADAGFSITAENDIWYPNFLENFQSMLPANLFVFQTIVKTKPVNKS